MGCHSWQSSALAAGLLNQSQSPQNQSLATVADPKMNTTHPEFLSGISLEARECPVLLGWENVSQGRTDGQGPTLKEAAWPGNCAKAQSDWREGVERREKVRVQMRERKRGEEGAQEEERTLKRQVEGGRYRHM